MLVALGTGMGVAGQTSSGVRRHLGASQDPDDLVT